MGDLYYILLCIGTAVLGRCLLRQRPPVEKKNSRQHHRAPVEPRRSVRRATDHPKEKEVLPFYIKSAEPKKERTNEKSARKEERAGYYEV